MLPLSAAMLSRRDALLAVAAAAEAAAAAIQRVICLSFSGREENDAFFEPGRTKIANLKDDL